MRTVTRCNTLQRATHCNTLQQNRNSFTWGSFCTRARRFPFSFRCKLIDQYIYICDMALVTWQDGSCVGGTWLIRMYDMIHSRWWKPLFRLFRVKSKVHCNIMHNTATHRRTLQHTATHRNTPHIHVQDLGLPCLFQFKSKAHCNTPQHTATHCNTTLQHTATPHTGCTMATFVPIQVSIQWICSDSLNRLIYLCNMTHIKHRTPSFVTYMTWLIHMCRMTHMHT